MAAQRSVQLAQSFPLLVRPCVWRRLATAAASNEAAATEKPASPPLVNTSRRVYLLNRTTPETTDLRTAIRALRAYSFAETETVELSIKCNMSAKKGKARDPFRGNLLYPYSFGQLRSVLFFAEDAHAAEAKAAGANIVGGEELAKKLSEDGDVGMFDICLATPTMYEKIKGLQKKLRAKMPNPRKGTVVQDNIAGAVKMFKGSREFKSDKHGYVNMAVGMLNFPDDHIDVNLRTLVDEVGEHKGSLGKATFIQRLVISTTYGPGIWLRVQDLC